jgi:hypothetical protein
MPAQPPTTELLDQIAVEISQLDVPRGRGRPGAEILLAFDRELGEADLVAAAGPKTGHLQANPIKALRDHHHQLARLLASGVPNVEAAAITGYSQSRISILKGDPSFRELLAYYRELKKEIFVDAQQRLAHLGLSAAAELQERLEDAPKSFSHRELNEIMRDTLDRSGQVANPRSGALAPGGAAPVSLTVNFVRSPNANAPKPNRENQTIDAVVDLEIDEESGP